MLNALNINSYNAILQSAEQLNIGYVILFSMSSSILATIGGSTDALQGRMVIMKEKMVKFISKVDKGNFALVRSMVSSLSEIYSVLDPKSRGTLSTTVLSRVSEEIAFINSNRHDTAKIEICGEILQAIFELLLLSSPPEAHDELGYVQYVVSYLAALQDLSPTIASVDSKMIRKLFQQNARSWSADVYREIVDELVHISFPANNYCQRKYIEALTCLITLDESRNRIAHYPFLVKNVSLICCSLVLGLSKITSPKLFLSILHMLESVLKEQPSLVSPFVYEQICIFMILSTSRSGPPLFDEYDIDDLYLRLCSITSTLLLSFRKFLRGHHNLIIRILQNLLYALCVPRPFGASRRIDKSIQNHWKRAIWLSRTSACSASCALAYSRLISNLCEPPTRSGKDSGKRISEDGPEAPSFSLSSAAGASRRALSKHAPYLLVEYCYANLNYNFDPEVRQALTQGVYTLLDSLGQNELKITNAALDMAARAVFKSVYEDYLKFGKWHES
ncbi:Urb2/Npa2 family-domain-containing protein [Lipomyces kononenkoae]|uniref:Urb2/Npa2 family-domain-containing protein n=1 Tax=Lipomyces kononenkoae TaxID=34357 RepID=A0ACC3TCD7_LIPKO